MLSRSLSNEIKGYAHEFFTTINHGLSLEAFSDLIVENVWSPIVWKDGKRKRANFICAKYLALDFDDGTWTLEDAKAWIKKHNYAAIIGTSKSHQKEKVKASGKTDPAVDRYRIVIPFEKAITDRELYEYQMVLATTETPCDPSCKDAARFFYPCKEIYLATPGLHYPVTPFGDDHEAEEKRIERAQRKVKDYEYTGTLPVWVSKAFLFGAPIGERHKMIFRLGSQLSLAGWTVDRIVETIMSSPLAHTDNADEIRRTVKNGRNANGKG